MPAFFGLNNSRNNKNINAHGQIDTEKLSLLFGLIFDCQHLKTKNPT